MRASSVLLWAILTAIAVPARAEDPVPPRSALYMQFIAQSEQDRSYWCGPILFRAGDISSLRELTLRAQHDGAMDEPARSDAMIQEDIARNLMMRGNAWTVYSADVDRQKARTVWDQVNALERNDRDTLELGLYCMEYVHLQRKDMVRYMDIMDDADKDWRRGERTSIGLADIIHDPSLTGRDGAGD